MSRVLESVLPDSIQNEGLLFVPSILEDVMRGRLDRELPVKLPEGYEPVSERAAAFDRARRIYKKFKDQENQSNYRVVTRTFVTNLLNNALGWTLPADKIDNDNPFLVLPFVEDDVVGRAVPSPPQPRQNETSVGVWLNSVNHDRPANRNAAILGNNLRSKSVRIIGAIMATKHTMSLLV